MSTKVFATHVSMNFDQNQQSDHHNMTATDSLVR